jgi:hypothetical protein
MLQAYVKGVVSVELIDGSRVNCFVNPCADRETGSQFASYISCGESVQIRVRRTGDRYFEVRDVGDVIEECKY